MDAVDRKYRQKFDINMTYHLTDQVPFTYFIDMLYYFDYWPVTPKKQDVPAVMMISNCEDKVGRLEYMVELMKHMPIDSYGQCLNNKV